MAIREAKSKRLAVLSPYGHLRGIYIQCGLHEGKSAFVRLMREGMDPTAITYMFFTRIFSSGPHWYFGKSLPHDTPGCCSMESFCSAPGDVTFPEAANWPHEDIFEVREATEKDEENVYFFPAGKWDTPWSSGAGGRQAGGFNPTGCNSGHAMDTHLSVLGLTKADFDVKSVRAAYRKLALRLHPDKAGNKEEFQALQNAYEAVIKALTGERKLVEPEQPEAQPSQATSAENRTEEDPKVSEEEKKLRRQWAAEAAERRQGQSSRQTL